MFMVNHTQCPRNVTPVQIEYCMFLIVPERLGSVITSCLHQLPQLGRVGCFSKVLVQQIKGEQIPDSLLTCVAQYSWNFIVKYEIFEEKNDIEH